MYRITQTTAIIKKNNKTAGKLHINHNLEQDEGDTG